MITTKQCEAILNRLLAVCDIDFCGLSHAELTEIIKEAYKELETTTEVK